VKTIPAAACQSATLITPQGSRSPSLVTDRPNNEFLVRAVGDKDPKEMLTFCEARRFKSCGIGQLNRYL
jgi:hypothetical protein